MAERVYAQDTKVSVDRSQAEVKQILRTLGADRIAVFETSEENFMVFAKDNVTYKLSQVPVDIKGKSPEQCEKAAWRALVLLVKAKKVAIEQGITTIEREFMADTVMSDGSTLIDHRDTLISHNYQDGPPQIGWAG